MNEAEVDRYLHQLDIKVTYPTSRTNEKFKPIKSFLYSGLDDKILEEIKRSGYDKPSAIQAISLPIALSGRDMIGLAQTGSGKTLAYIWPSLGIIRQTNV